MTDLPSPRHWLTRILPLSDRKDAAPMLGWDGTYGMYCRDQYGNAFPVSRGYPTPYAAERAYNA